VQLKASYASLPPCTDRSHSLLLLFVDACTQIYTHIHLCIHIHIDFGGTTHGHIAHSPLSQPRAFSLWVIFHKRTLQVVALLWKMTCNFEFGGTTHRHIARSPAARG